MFKYKILKSVIKKKECIKIIDKIDSSIKRQSLLLNKKNKKVYLNELMNPLSYDPYFFSLFKYKKVNKLCHKILGKNHYLNAFAALKKIPVVGKLRSDKFHIDGKYELKSIKDNLQLNVLFSLTRSNKFHGTTAIKDKKKIKYLSLDPGDCLIFNSFIEHKGTPNNSNISRYIIGYNLIPHFIKPRFDFVHMTKKYKLDKNLKKFLGYNFVPPKNMSDYFKKKTYFL
tara:strand:+ start:305 stop:985 length:681 start_codon:yes stop_codon:yes gene_type:complete